AHGPRHDPPLVSRAAGERPPRGGDRPPRPRATVRRAALRGRARRRAGRGPRVRERARAFHLREPDEGRSGRGQTFARWGDQDHLAAGGAPRAGARGRGDDEGGSLAMTFHSILPTQLGQLVAAAGKDPWLGILDAAFPVLVAWTRTPILAGSRALVYP